MLGKVMWVGRATVFLVGLDVILALVFGVASTALSATGGNFILGKGNTATTPTSLVSTLADALKSALIVQNKSGGPALDLRVGNATTPANNVAPMKVNSQKLVTNLNADKLDGKSDTDFYAAGSKVADSSHADQADSATNAQNANTLEGKTASEFANATHAHSGADVTSGTVAEAHIDGTVTRDSEVMNIAKANDGSGSGLDADKLDGKDASQLGGPGRSDVLNNCDPLSDIQYLACASVDLSLPSDGRVLLIADGQWRQQTGTADGRCRFFGPGTSNDQVELGGGVAAGSLGLTEVTSPLTAGTHTFGIQCREFAGNTIFFPDMNMSAVYVGSS